jgi:hypothetical protein
MLAHFATRGLMHEAALKADIDPDRLSFVHAVQVIRRKLPQAPAIPPSEERRAWHEAVLDEISQERLPPRRHRRNKRGVKRKMSNFPLRRKSDKPLPPVNIAQAIRIQRARRRPQSSAARRWRAGVFPSRPDAS